MLKRLNELAATELARQLADKKITAEALARACIERIEAREPEVGAWANFNAGQVLAAARTLDQGPWRGMLHGIPFGVKDILDTVDYPTECGTPIYAGRKTSWDAACVAAAKAAGGIVLGKTVSTELAYFSPGKTRNPHNTAHTPGGSSSGSAAAVADYMAPLAFATQTAGSLIRPAAFCGIVGYKPSFNLVARAGMKLAAESLDTIGFFARSVADAALMAAAVSGRQTLATLRPFASPLRVGVCRTPEWSKASDETRALFEAVEDRLAIAGKVSEIVLPEIFNESNHTQQTIMAYEIARGYAFEWQIHRERLSEPLRKLIGEGLTMPPERYDAACAHARGCQAKLADIFRVVDVLVTPSAVGEAPATLINTGDPVFNRLWTLLGTPAVNLPAGLGPRGLPLGYQVIGPRGADALTLSAAHRIAQALAGTA